MVEVHWVKAWDMCMGEPYHDEHHGTFNSLEEAQESVREWWQKNDYEPRYVRQMADEDGNTWWDYGPHSAFYVFKECVAMSKEEKEELAKLEELKNEFKKNLDESPTDLNKRLYNDVVTDVWALKEKIHNDEQARRERCQDCVYLVGGDNGEWICDQFEAECEDIEDCPEWEKSKEE